MAEQPAKKPSESPKEVLDLNSLSGLDFGPNWADGSQKKSSSSKGFRDGGNRHSGGARPSGKPDRRGGSRPNRGSPSHSKKDEGEPSRHGRRNAPRSPDREQLFEPTLKVDLYPQDEAFEALVKRLRSTVRTYQLFEIAHLLLEKPERFVVLVTNFAAKGAAAAPLYFSVPGHLPFETEEAAVAYVLKEHLELFFEVEAVEVEAPKGNFQMVNRCGMTGALLGPPNYHRYQEFAQKHYNEKINGTSYEKFISKIETVKDPEVIEVWTESMKQGFRYVLKDRSEGEPEHFETLDAVKHFLLQNRKDKVVGSGESIRFAGRDISKLPDGDIRKSVEAYVLQQQKFPLDAANNIRGRLRRHKFTVYKKGSKGVSVVCAVKRKFRESGTLFTDSVQALIEFIEKNPEIAASKLPKEYIGIDTEKQRPDKLVVSEEDIAAAKEAAAVPEEADQAETTVAQSSEVAPDAKASTEATPKDSLSNDEMKRLNLLMSDLRWLIVEGYVTEYGDGRLFAAPPMPEPKKDKKIEAGANKETVATEPMPGIEPPTDSSVTEGSAVADEKNDSTTEQLKSLENEPEPEQPKE